MPASPSAASPWRSLLTAGLVLLAGFLAYIAILLFEELVTTDMRWGLWLGCVLLFALSVRLGRCGPWVPFFVAAPLVAFHGVPIASDITSFWPFPVFWLASAVAGWLASRGPTWVTVAAPVTLAAAFLFYGGKVLPGVFTDELNQYVDEPAPALTLEYLDGRPYPVDTFAGNIVVLDFFATWCIPCRAELPEIEELRHKLADRDDVIMLVVGDGDAGETPEIVQAYADSAELDLPFVWDPGGVAHDAFGFWNIPALAVIDREGRVRLKRVGYNAAETGFQATLLELIESL